MTVKKELIFFLKKNSRNFLWIRSRLYKAWISYPPDKHYPADKRAIQRIVICKFDPLDKDLSGG
jgi:hypothetical protein